MLTNDELDFLDGILGGKETGHVIRNASECHGFLTAIVSSPQLISPSHWMDLIFEGIADSDLEEELLQMASTIVMMMYNDIIKTFETNPMRFEPLFIELESDVDLPITEYWIAGYLMGFKIWDIAEGKGPEHFPILLGILQLFDGRNKPAKKTAITPKIRKEWDDQTTLLIGLIVGTYEFFFKQRSPETESDNPYPHLKLVKSKSAKQQPKQTTKKAVVPKRPEPFVFDDISTITKPMIKKFWKVNGKAEIIKLNEQAQTLMYEAWERDMHEAVDLAYDALELSPFCLDAFNLIADYDTELYSKAIRLFELAIYAGDILLKEQLASGMNQLWLDLDCRPYLRSLFGLAKDFKDYGRMDKAIPILERILELNQNDNQGARYPLLTCLLAKDELEKAQSLLTEYEEESAFWLYSQALLAYITMDPQRDKIAKQAVKANKHIAQHLRAKLIAENLLMPSYFSKASSEEADYYYIENHILWRLRFGAIEWISGFIK